MATPAITAANAAPTTLTPRLRPPDLGLGAASLVLSPLAPTNCAPNTPSVVVLLVSPLTATATVAGAVISLPLTVPTVAVTVVVVQLQALPHWPQGP